MVYGSTITGAVSAVTVLAAGIALLAGSAAQASEVGTLAEPGSGLGDFHLGDGYYKGSFVQGGDRMICGEKGTSVPTGQLVASGMQDAGWINAHYVSGWGQSPALTDDQVAGLNRLFHEKLGQSAVMDAAIEYTTHEVMYPGLWRDLNGEPVASLNGMIATDLSMPEVNAAEDIAAVQRYVAEFVDLVNTTAASVQVAGEGELLFTAGPDQFTKTVTVEATEGATGTATLTNAVFADTGEATRAVEAGDVLTVRVQAPEGASSTVEVQGTADMTVGTPGYAPQLATWQPEAGVNQQSTLGLGPVAEATSFQIEGALSAEITKDEPVALVATGDGDASAEVFPIVAGAGGLAVALIGAVGFLRARRRAAAVRATESF